jgi:hypothetical protein
MESRIQDVTQYYAKFQNILPEGLLDSNKNDNIKITEEVRKSASNKIAIHRNFREYRTKKRKKTTSLLQEILGIRKE